MAEFTNIYNKTTYMLVSLSCVALNTQRICQYCNITWNIEFDFWDNGNSVGKLR